MTGGQVKLHQVVGGPSKGPRVVLVHGFPDGWRVWRYQLAPLIEAGCRVVALDLRGYGLSDKPTRPSDYALERLVGDLLEVIGGQDTHLVGHDWGGWLTWHAAMRKPEQVRSLTVLSIPHPAHLPTMVADLAQLRRGWYASLLTLASRTGTIPPNAARQLVDVVERNLVRARLDQRSRELQLLELARPGVVPSILMYYRTMIEANPARARTDLRPLDLPVQVVWGRQDPFLLARYAQPPALWVERAQLCMLADAGHWPQLDCPEQVRDLILAQVRG